METHSSNTSPAQASDGQHIRLACQACQRKKIKCDRTFPCGQCQRSNLQCLQSTRKPRVRHTTTKRAGDSELRSRISKLESLVESLSGDPALPESETRDEHVDHLEPPGKDIPSPPAVGKYMSSPFWATLTNEVQALRDAFEEDVSDGETVEESPASVGQSENASTVHDLLICPPASVYVMPGALPDPSPSAASQLYEIFLNNADPVYKVLHRPTIKRFLDGDDSYLGHAADSPPNKALKTALWFAAVTTIQDAECYARFEKSRADLLHFYRRHVDVALVHADLINTRDLATLQAFLLYTAASRITDQSRRPWTMAGLVVRIAFGLGIHHESPTDSPYMKETKRRTWHMIRVLDAFAAVDRGTEPVINNMSFDTPLPSNVNDSEYDEKSTSIPNQESGLTDTTFNLMAYAATSLTMQLLTPERDDSKRETWQQRLDKALEVGKQLQERFLQYCDLSIPFQRFLHAVGSSMSASMVLRAVRPMQRHISSVPPRVDSPFVLQLAVNSLRNSESTHADPEAAGWRWIFWAQWHALAVALAGLCSIRDTELANTAWVWVDKSYDRHSRQIADTRNGMLWRPLEKLYKKASAFRDGTTASQQSTPGNNTISLPLQQGPLPSTTSPPVQQFMLPNGQTAVPHTIPLTGLLNQSMEIDFGEGGFGGLSPLQANDMSWLDWENLMQDMSSVNADPIAGAQDNLTLGDTQPGMNGQPAWPSGWQNLM